MKIKNERGPNTKLCGTLEFIFLQSDVGHLILCFIHDYQENL